VTIYHGDCWDVIPSLVGVDAVVTDPPYGIGTDTRQSDRANKQHGKALAPSRDYGHSNWDALPPSDRDMRRLLSVGAHHIVWGGNYFGLKPTSGWLVWDKDNGTNGYADCELAWTDMPMAIRRLRFRWMGMLQQIPEERYHPTQKPLPVMRWCVGLLPDTAKLVLDPYMGSGTTLRAAKDLGLRAIGIDAEERYCEIAAVRCAQDVSPALSPASAAPARRTRARARPTVGRHPGSPKTRPPRAPTPERSQA
jgi:DNA modification methylase